MRITNSFLFKLFQTQERRLDYFGKELAALESKVTTPSASNNAQRDAIIAEAVEAWREWDALPDTMFSDRLVNAMHALSDLYPKQ